MRATGNSWTASMRLVPAALDLRLILDNYGTHKTPLIHRWLGRYPRFTYTSLQPVLPG